MKTSPNTKLTSEQVLEIVARCRAGESYRAIARSYPVSSATVCEIVAGRVWSRITGIPPRPKGAFANPPYPKGAFPRGESHPLVKLTAAQVLEVVERRGAGETCSSIASSLGIANMTVSSIMRGYSWRHLTGIERQPKRPRPRLSPAVVRGMRIRYAHGETQKDLAEYFSLSRPSISCIVNRKSYRDVD